MPDLQSETTELLGALIRFNTVNPPGNERPAIEHLEAYLAAAGFETEILGQTDARANLVATLDSGVPGPALVYLGHVDTVLAEPSDWRQDPWSGAVVGRLSVGPRVAGHEEPGRCRGRRRRVACARAAGARRAEP